MIKYDIKGKRYTMWYTIQQHWKKNLTSKIKYNNLSAPKTVATKIKPNNPSEAVKSQFLLVLKKDWLQLHYLQVSCQLQS